MDEDMTILAPKVVEHDNFMYRGGDTHAFSDSRSSDHGATGDVLDVVPSKVGAGVGRGYQDPGAVAG